MLRDELEELRMVAQKCLAQMAKEDNSGKVLINPHVLLDLLDAYEEWQIWEASSAEIDRGRRGL